MRDGGYSMWLVLVFGGITLVAAGLQAWRFREPRTGVIRAMTAATVFAVLSGLSSNLAAVFYHVSGRDDWYHDPEMPRIVMRGLAEATGPLTLGFSLLGVAWLLLAFGIRRAQA
jgi:hypothetical protein